MNSLITTSGDQPVVLSTTVAKQLERRHDTVLRAVESLIESGHIGDHEFVATSYLDKSNRQSKCYALSEDAFLIAMPFIGGKKSRDGQRALIKAFSTYRRQKEHRVILNWQQSRLENKQARHTETNVIQQFVDYAVQQGSKGATHYYQNLTKLTNKILSITAGQRDSLNVAQLGMLTTAEHLISVTLIEGMRNGLHYKSIYLLVKERLQALGQALGSALSPDNGGNITNASNFTGEI